MGWSLGALVFLFCGCSTSDAPVEGSGNGGGLISSPGDGAELDLGPGLAGGPPTNGGLHPLCGMGTCIPDREDACEELPEAAGGAGGAAAPYGAAGSLSINPGDLGMRAAACHVLVEPDCQGDDCSVLRVCEIGGSGESGAPCVVAEDCAAGLACTGEGAAGVCRPFCCEGNEVSCGAGTFCDERPLTDSPSTYVPVCVAAQDCPLTEPYPCTGPECVCQGDAACVVVRQDGTTGCTTPGPGRAGDSCTALSTAECGHGFVCAPEAGCMQLCSTASEVSGCSEGAACQALTVLGEGLGVCIGLEDEGTEAAR